MFYRRVGVYNFNFKIKNSYKNYLHARTLYILHYMRECK